MAQESMSDYFQYAKDRAKAEKDLKIERWVYISIEYKEKLESVRLFTYNLPREVYERRTWVIRWRQSKLQCQHPKQNVVCYFSYYDRRSGESLEFNSFLSNLISSKAQVTKAERKMREYIEYNRQNNMFFDEDTDEELIKFKAKLEQKKTNVFECEKQLENLITKQNHGNKDDTSAIRY